MVAKGPEPTLRLRAQSSDGAPVCYESVCELGAAILIRGLKSF